MATAHRAITLSVIALSVLVSFLVLSSLAAASPISEKKARLQAVQSQLVGVHEQTDVAVERYNEANSELVAVQEQVRRNRQLLKLAEYKLAVANTHLQARQADLHGRGRRHHRCHPLIRQLRGTGHSAEGDAAAQRERRRHCRRGCRVPPGGEGPTRCA